MKISIFATLAIFFLATFSACAKPPQKVVEEGIRRDVGRQTMMASMYGGEGTGIRRIAITKEYTESRGETTLYFFEYEVDFRFAPRVKGERDRVEKIRGRLSLYKQGDRWERYE